MSDDIKNFREAVSKFDELIISQETINEDMKNNFNNYKEVNNAINNGTEKNKEIIEAITQLQINQKNLIENLDKANTESKKTNAQSKEINSESKRISINTVNTVKNETDNIQRSIQLSVSNVDLSQFNKNVKKEVKKIFTDEASPIFDGVKTALELHKRETEQISEEINEINIKRKNETNEINQDFKKVYEDKELWLKKIQEQNDRDKKLYKTPRNFFMIMLLVMIISYIGGLATSKNLTGKEIFETQKINISKLINEGKRLNMKFIKIERLKKEMTKNDKRLGENIFIPQWLISIFVIALISSLIFFILYKNMYKNKEDNKYSSY